MIYCSQPRALKSTATPRTGEGVRKVAKDRNTERGKQSERKGKGWNDNDKRCPLLTDSLQRVKKKADTLVGEGGNTVESGDEQKRN